MSSHQTPNRRGRQSPYEVCNRKQRDERKRGEREKENSHQINNQQVKRNLSPVFNREGSQRPVISGGMWNVIVANGQRSGRSETASHGSSSKRSRGDSHEVQWPSDTRRHSNVAQTSSGLAKRRIPDPLGDLSPDSASDVSTVKIFLSTRSNESGKSGNFPPRRRFSSSQGNGHLRDESGRRNVASRALDPSRRQRKRRRYQ